MWYLRGRPKSITSWCVRCRSKKGKGDTAEAGDKGDGDNEEAGDSPDEQAQEEEEEVVWLTDTSKAAAEKRAQVRG
jgi:hypothetical protein